MPKPPLVSRRLPASRRLPPSGRVKPPVSGTVNPPVSGPPPCLTSGISPASRFPPVAPPLPVAPPRVVLLPPLPAVDPPDPTPVFPPVPPALPPAPAERAPSLDEQPHIPKDVTNALTAQIDSRYFVFIVVSPLLQKFLENPCLQALSEGLWSGCLLLLLASKSAKPPAFVKIMRSNALPMLPTRCPRFRGCCLLAASTPNRIPGRSVKVVPDKRNLQLPRDLCSAPDC